MTSTVLHPLFQCCTQELRKNTPCTASVDCYTAQSIVEKQGQRSAWTAAILRFIATRQDPRNRIPFISAIYLMTRFFCNLQKKRAVLRKGLHFTAAVVGISHRVSYRDMRLYSNQCSLSLHDLSSIDQNRSAVGYPSNSSLPNLCSSERWYQGTRDSAVPPVAPESKYCDICQRRSMSACACITYPIPSLICQTT